MIDSFIKLINQLQISPNLGWYEVRVDAFTNLEISIANLEFMIALILSFLFANHLNKTEKYIHLYVDKQNALTRSRGVIYNNSIHVSCLC